MPRSIVIGGTMEIPHGRADVFLLPGEDRPPTMRTDVSFYMPKDLPDCLNMLRNVFADYPVIATLGGAQIVGTDPEWRDAVERRVSEFLEDLGNCPIDSWKGARNCIANSRLVASGSTSRELTGVLAGMPAICLGAGPSATPEAMAQIARLSRNHYVFAADSMMHACQRAGFAPQFVTMIERDTKMAQFVVGADLSSTLIAPPIIEPSSAEPFWSHCWWWGGDDIYRWMDPAIEPKNLGRSAGTLGIGAAILAGCNPIYLVGHDLAYAPGMNSHCPGVHAYARDTQVADDAKPATTGLYQFSHFEVPGFAGAPVTTNGLWNLFRGDIEMMVAQNRDRRFVSAQKWAGAKIEGVEVNDLPEYGPLGTAAAITLPTGNVRSPLSRVPSLLTDLERVINVCDGTAKSLLVKEDPPMDRIATMLAVGNLLRTDNVDLFRYVFRSIYSTLSLRLHLRAETVPEPREMQRQCLLLLAETLSKLCAHMRDELIK